MNKNISPERNAVIFEDSKEVIDVLSRLLNIYGWNVVRTASTVKESTTLIEKLGGLNILITFIDGFLTNYPCYEFEGGMISKKIKEQYPDIKTVGISSNDAQEEDPNIDYWMKKELSEVETAISKVGL